MLSLLELFPDLQSLNLDKKTLPKQLKLFLQQKDLKIDNDSLLNHNPYLNRLVKECELFLPEIIYDNWQRLWDYQIAQIFEGNWLDSIFDWAINPENSEAVIFDWLGVKNNPVARARAYLLHQKPELFDYNISIAYLARNPLPSARCIEITRQTIEPQELVIIEREIGERIKLLKEGKNLLSTLNSQPVESELNPIQIIEEIPEIIIE